MAQIILTHPPSSSSGIPGTIITGVSIPFAPGTNIVRVDNTPIGENTSIKWIYTLWSTAQDKVVTAEVLATYRLVGGTIRFNRTSIVGDKRDLRHSVDVITSGGNFSLQITNLTDALPSKIDFVVNIVRIQLLS